MSITGVDWCACRGSTPAAVAVGGGGRISDSRLLRALCCRLMVQTFGALADGSLCWWSSAVFAHLFGGR